MLSHLFRELILPPGCLILAALAAFLLRRRYRRAAISLGLCTWSALYLLSLPITAVWLTRLAERHPPLTPSAIATFSPQAIVVLGGGAEVDVAEYDGAAVPSPSSLQRLAYAAYLVKKTGLPVLVSGGYGNTPEQSEGWAMRATLAAQGIPTKWTETRSRNTRENATMSVALLKSDGITRVLLVTSATHAQRAARAFEVAGMQVLPAPTGFARLGPWETGLMMMVPTSGRLHASSEALRAFLAELWYSVTGS